MEAASQRNGARGRARPCQAAPSIPPVRSHWRPLLRFLPCPLRRAAMRACRRGARRLWLPWGVGSSVRGYSLLPFHAPAGDARVVTHARLRHTEVNTPAQKEKAVIRQAKNATTTPKLLSRVEALRLLSRVEEAGLLSLGAWRRTPCLLPSTTRGFGAASRAPARPYALRRALVALPLSPP